MKRVKRALVVSAYIVLAFGVAKAQVLDLHGPARAGCDYKWPALQLPVSEYQSYIESCMRKATESVPPVSDPYGLNSGRSSITFASNPICCTIIILSVLAYLGAINYLITYLRRVYTMTWVELGEFTLWDARRRQLNGDLIKWYLAGMRTFGFVLFSNRYKVMEDRKLTGLIWLVRASFTLSLALMLSVMTSDLIQRYR